MKITTPFLALAATIAATPAFAHPGHGADAHAHWEYLAVAACVAALFVWRDRKAG
ncbi:MAG: hypothetical protein AAF441_24870 [Pseudomonadota bacterium]